MAARSARAGLTLIELLLAITIAVLLVAVVLSTYRTVHAVAAGQQERVQTRQAAADAVELLQDDLMRLFEAGRPETRIVLTQQVGQAAVSFCAIERPPGERDLRWGRALRIEWSATPRGDGLALARATRPLTGPGSQGAPVTNLLVEDLGDFQVSFHDGTNWVDRWPPGSSNVVPRSARLAIRSRAAPTGEAWKLEVWIPAGATFTSSLQRTAATVPAP